MPKRVGRGRGALTIFSNVSVGNTNTVNQFSIGGQNCQYIVQERQTQEIFGNSSVVPSDTHMSKVCKSKSGEQVFFYCNLEFYPFDCLGGVVKTNILHHNNLFV